MLVLKNANIILDENCILQGIDFEWQTGKAVALCGANGAGKSTLLKVIAGFIKPSSGTIHYPGEIDLRQWRRLLGVVFPESFLYETLTAEENLQFYAGLYGVKDQFRSEQLLEEIGLSHVRHQYVHSFSKGMKQRLSIARALIHRPSYLLLDEPFEGLDVQSRALLQQMLIRLKENGVALLIVNHQIEQIWDLCDRAVLIHEGKQVMQETCREDTYQLFAEKYNRQLQEKPHDIF